MSRPRRGVLLLLVLVSLVLLAALVAPLATLSGVSALESTHRAATLRHRLAADSVLAVLPQLLASDRRLARELERGNRAHLTLELEDLHVEVLLQDDTAKLPLPLSRAQRGPAPRRAALAVLAAALPLPPLAAREADTPAAVGDVPWTGCLEDLFDAPTDRALYGTPTEGTAWTQYLTPLGQTVQAYRADPAVLEAALADLQPGLGTRLAQARTRQTQPDVDELLAGAELKDEVHKAARSRLVSATERLSLLVRTQLGSDVRQRYLVCTAGPEPRVLLDWEVAP